MTLTGPLTSSQRDWLRVRSYLTEHRYDLAVRAAEDYPAAQRVAGTPLLTRPSWLPAAPVPLDQISLGFTEPPAGPPAVSHAATAAGTPLLPERPDGTRYLSYAEAVADLGAPATFENRPTYRLTAAALNPPAVNPPGLDPSGLDPSGLGLAFTRGRYFDGIDTGEAAAHEFAAARLGAGPPRGRGLRAAVADPCDLDARPANLAISTLTLRLDAATGRASFLLHWRDPARVGHAGGLYQVIPVGVFQPAGPDRASERAGFSLWSGMIREFDEELRGAPEDYGARPAGDAWPFARRMSDALAAGEIRVWCLGLGTDPLTWATDLLTVAVIDSRLFDQLFSLAPRPNDEGRVLAARDFAPHVIDRIVSREPVQAAGAAVLRLAWTHREVLTG
ncbi:MAG: hypothetical protein WAK82_41435 [Streptosporangiaceae bacterium]